MKEIEITEWQKTQLEKVLEQKRNVLEKEDLLIKTILDSKGIDFNTISAANFNNGKLTVTLKS